MYGPALTRLTANQAINLLQDKPMLCWLYVNGSDTCKHSTVQQRMQDLHEVTFSGLSVAWPPELFGPLSFFDRSRVGCLDKNYFTFHGSYVTPAPLQTPDLESIYAQQPDQVCVCASDAPLLMTTERLVAGAQPSRRSRNFTGHLHKQKHQTE
jgi:hypothetical protein